MGTQPATRPPGIRSDILVCAALFLNQFGEITLLSRHSPVRPEERHMSIAQQVVSHLPYLRRYARALTGSQKSGDAYVIALLEALVEDTGGFDRKLPSRVALYRLFTRMWNSVAINTEAGGGASIAESRLDALTPQSRQAFLLTAMERFDENDAALVLDTSVEELRALIAVAVREIAEQVATQVLIIEDEPLIAMDLEAIMEDIGHTVVGVARTHREAIEIARDRKIGLILADIQLADGSSGIDAVNELLESVEAPVIFITAFPERLLTGQRAEPTYLVTKPFQASLVTALSSQALFFGEKAGRSAS
jgi:CheY-like chemotaxis protein/DNA-directed RNA polymerase specialized sigma24 family protein